MEYTNFLLVLWRKRDTFSMLSSDVFFATHKYGVEFERAFLPKSVDPGMNYMPLETIWLRGDQSSKERQTVISIVNKIARKYGVDVSFIPVPIALELRRKETKGRKR